MLSLSCYRRNVSLVFRSLFFGRGTRIDSTFATVVTDTRDVGGVVNHRRVVHVVNVSDIYVVDRAVVKKMSTLPPSTFVSMAEVTKTVNDAAIKTDYWPPIAFV